jgi:DNA-binding phage protein
MQLPETNLQSLSMARLSEAVRAYGLQKQLAQDTGMSDADLSRLLHDQAPRLIRVLSVLGLELVQAGHVTDLRRVLKEVL